MALYAAAIKRDSLEILPSYPCPGHFMCTLLSLLLEVSTDLVGFFPIFIL